MKKQNFSWPFSLPPSAFLWGLLHTLVIALCLHVCWGCMHLTVYDHVNHSLPPILQWPPVYDFQDDCWPILCQVFMEAILISFLALFIHRLQWLVWLAAATLGGWGLGNLVFHVFNRLF